MFNRSSLFVAILSGVLALLRYLIPWSKNRSRYGFSSLVYSTDPYDEFHNSRKQK